MSLDALQPPKTWRDYLVPDQEPDKPEVFVKIGKTAIWSAASHSLIAGKKKSRKSLLVAYFISQYQGDIKKDILLADTEQGQHRTWKMKNKVFKLTGVWLNALDLRGLSTIERKATIEAAITEGGYKIIVIDGIRDLISNINDPNQSTDLVTWLEKMISQTGVHICNILHLNKGNEEVRGHIGSELENKGEIIIGLESDKTGVSIVNCRDSRDIPFDSFAIRHDINELPELCSMPNKGEVLSEFEMKRKLVAIFDGELLKHSEVITGIKDHFKCGQNGAGHKLTEFVHERGWIIKNGKDRSPDTRYKLLVVV